MPDGTGHDGKYDTLEQLYTNINKWTTIKEKCYILNIPTNAPMDCVMPPTSSFATDVFRRKSKKVVLP